MYQERTADLQKKLRAQNIALALITDDDSVYYYTGFFDYLHMDFGRPTVLVIPANDDCHLITPSIELEMAERMVDWIHIDAWQDGLGDEWRGPLKQLLEKYKKGVVSLEINQMPPVVRNFVNGSVEAERLNNITPTIAHMRMVKSPEELQLARHAGQVAEAMMMAGREAIGDGVPEFEVALATSAAGTRKAAQLLEQHYDEPRMSPNTHFLQIMSSGSEITMPHHRATPRIMKHGEPVFLCFCGMTNFHRFKLGFDRTFWIGNIMDSRQADIYQVAVDSQAAALEVIKSGVVAEDVHAAYTKIIRGAGYDYPFRCGRATGYSFLELPQLVSGDTTVLQPGMVLAVDGSVSVSGFFRAQVGDSIIVTEDGYEPLTSFPKDINNIVIN